MPTCDSFQQLSMKHDITTNHVTNFLYAAIYCWLLYLMYHCVLFGDHRLRQWQCIVPTLSLRGYMLGLMSRMPLLSMSELGSVRTFKCIATRLNVLSFCVCAWKVSKPSPDISCLGDQFPYLRLASDFPPNHLSMLCYLIEVRPWLPGVETNSSQQLTMSPPPLFFLFVRSILAT